MTVVIDGTTGINTGTGSLIAANSTTPTYLDLYEDTDNGSNYVRLIAPTSVASDKTITLPDTTGTVALTSDVIGVGQTWTDVTGSRVAGTTYTNSTGKPIMVSVAITTTTTNASVNSTFTINGSIVANTTVNSSNGTSFPAIVQTYSFIIPNGSTYSCTAASLPSISRWWELR